jgi:2'-5' RNA ligase
MSLFVAVVPSIDAIDDLEHHVHHVRRDPLATTIRWQAAEQWHVTLAFLGDPPDDADESVARRLDAVAAEFPAPPALHLAGAGCFGRQILWIGVAGVTDDDASHFAGLERLLRSGLRADRFTLERRPWHPHLTVGRTRGSDARPLTPLLEHYRGPAWPVTELLAVRSEGGPHPRHTVVHRAQFRPRRDGRSA